MEHPLIKQDILENGVTLRLYDASRKIAGDRWLVALVASAIVPVKDALASEQAVSPEEAIKIRQALGEEIVFEQKRERYFIDEQQKETVFNQMLENLRSITSDYLAHPLFPSRFVKKSFREYLAKKRLKDQMNSGG